MKPQTKNNRSQDKRKFLLVLPLFILPFLTLGFYALGGGKGAQGLSGQEAMGINAALPDALDTDKELKDKMSFYNQAEKDSLKRLELARQDPYYLSVEGAQHLQDSPSTIDDFSNQAGMNTMAYRDPHEQQVYAKLAQLNQVLETGGKEEWEQDSPTSPPIGFGGNQDAGLRQDIERLEQMMLAMQSGAEPADAEMAGINTVLESVLDIQHPERVQERLKQQSKENLGQVFAVSAIKSLTPISLLDNKLVREYSAEYNQNIGKQENRFYGRGTQAEEAEEYNGIAAVVHETQTLVSGATVKLRLIDDVFINGTLIPKDHFVYGTAALQGERLQVEVEIIRYKNSLFPVKLSVHDMDGLPGIHIPGAITRDVAKQSGNQAIQGVSLGTLNSSLGAQAASAGMELGRNLLSKKIKLIKVEVKAGYQVLLRDGKKKD